MYPRKGEKCVKNCGKQRKNYLERVAADTWRAWAAAADSWAAAKAIDWIKKSEDKE